MNSMQKKIGIITILRVNNYGAELQAFALQHKLQLMGYDAEIIDYLFYKHPRHKKTRASRPIFHFSLKKRLSEFLYPLFSKIKSWRSLEVNRRREQKFIAFHEKYTKCSPEYRSVEELNHSVANYDVYMVGSDQVWNPGIYSSIAPYFLTFAPASAKRVSYASSFGVSVLPDTARTYYRDCLQKFAHIGVREMQAVELVKQLTGKSAQCVLDPTLLLDRDEWMQVAEPVSLPFAGEYILIYDLRDSLYMTNLAMYYAELLNRKVVRICNTAPIHNRTDIVDVYEAGPSEFLYLFANASLVLTNSFHGTAFSINFNKNFYTVVSAHKDNNSRQQSLLALLGLENRILREGAIYPMVEDIFIDYMEPNKKLKAERTLSEQFINNAINE